jgi:hypothetical protein
MPVAQRLTRLLLPALIGATALPATANAQAARGKAAGPAVSPVRELPRHYTGRPTTAAISAADLMTRLYIFADDSMMGRDAFSEYNTKGTAYIASELARLGIEPAGDDGYFQYALATKRTDSSLTTLSVDGNAFRLWHDFAPRDQGSGSRPFDGAQVVYGGSLGDTTHLISREAGAGRVVLLTLARDSAGRRDFNVNRFQITARFAAAAAILVQQLDYTPPGYVGQAYGQPQRVARSTVTSPSPSYFYVSNAVGRAMLGSDADAATPGTPGRTAHGSVRFAEAQAPGRNVIGVIRGSDPAFRGQYIAIGAHNDHVGFSRDGALDHDSVRAFHLVAAPQGADNGPHMPTADEALMIHRMTDSLHALHGGSRPDSIFNGADDDGSGSVSVLEIAEAFARARVKPKRSLLFIWHVGEEYGMFGSRYFTDHPTVPRDSIVVELNIDMIGRGGAGDFTGVTKEGRPIHGGPGYVQLVGSRRLSTELGDLAETVNTERHAGLAFDYSLDANGHPQNIYCRSDHWSYARVGIPVVFFTTGGHADYHQLTDEPQYIDYPRMERITTFVSQLATRVANLDHRVVVDKPRPDPNGTCQQ